MNAVNAIVNYWDTSLSFNREVSCFITPEHGVISMTSDDCGGSVDFGWETIWGFLRAQKIKASEVIMLHSHPMGYDEMSATDKNMVQGWRLGLGVPINFYIVTQHPKVINHIDDMGVVAHYVVDRTPDKKMIISDKVGYWLHELPPSFDIVAEIVYGMSKSPNLTKEDVKMVEVSLKEASLDFLCSGKK